MVFYFFAKIFSRFFLYTLFTLYILRVSFCTHKRRIFPRLLKIIKLSPKIEKWVWKLKFCRFLAIFFAFFASSQHITSLFCWLLMPSCHRFCFMWSRRSSGFGRCPHLVAYSIYATRLNTFVYRLIENRRGVYWFNLYVLTSLLLYT